MGRTGSCYESAATESSFELLRAEIAAATRSRPRSVTTRSPGSGGSLTCRAHPVDRSFDASVMAHQRILMRP